MELRQLRQFVTLGETLNFHQAALRLNMTQPPLSISIRTLEQELGTPLFTRSQKGVVLTAAGTAALVFARQALSEAEQMRAAVRNTAFGLRGSLRIGFVGSVTYGLLPQLLSPFRRLYPDVDIILTESTTQELIHHLPEGKVDIGLVRLPLMESTNVEVVVLESDRLVAAVQDGDPLARRQRIDLAELAEHPFLMYARISVLHRIVMLACQRAKFLPRTAQEAAQVQTLLCLVESGLGVALVPGVATKRAHPGIKFIELTKPPQIELGLALASNRAHPAAQNFRNVALTAR